MKLLPSKIIPLIPVEKVTADKLLSVVKNFTDIITDTNDADLISGGIGHIKGELLKLDDNDPQQGVFFIDKNCVETKVAFVARNIPGELIFMIPGTWKKGNYRIEVCAFIF